MLKVDTPLDNMLTVDTPTDNMLTVDTSGDCCFSIYSQPEAAGDLQSLQSEGGHHLQLQLVSSVYVVECEAPLIHPALKFFLIALVIILSLYCIWSKGKEYLFRRRV